MDDIMSLDLYELIGTVPSSTVSEIKKAYRKKALSCHPDKNPDNPRAAELFHELSRALEILTDASARAAYDKVLAARQQAKLRVKQFDAKRKKLKEDLEAREEAYLRSLNRDTRTDEEKLKTEIERLRKEGSKQVEEEVAFVKQKIWEQLNGSQAQTDEQPEFYRIKIKWKASKDDPKNGGYDYDTLHRILSKYGEIAAVVVSPIKKGRAMAEYKDRSAAELAARIEVGLAENPLIIQGLWNTNKPSRKCTNESFKTAQGTTLFQAYQSTNTAQTSPNVSFPSAPDIFTNQQRMSDAEFESSVLSNLRRMEERKRLLEKLKTEEGI